MNRREFLKTAGVASGAVALAACGGSVGGPIAGIDPMGHHTDEVPIGKMTYRTNPNTDDKVSILGYGMMRLPNRQLDPSSDQRPTPAEEIDQEQVNRLVRYALDHGVNYFDTSPAYCRGYSETATGIALKA